MGDTQLYIVIAVLAASLFLAIRTGMQINTLISSMPWYVWIILLLALLFIVGGKRK